MGNIFSYAREKIKKQYESRYDYSCKDVQRLEENKLSHIDFYEKTAKENFKEAIACRFGAFWYVQTDEEKLFIGLGIAVILFTLYIFLYGIKDTPLNILILNASSSFFFCFGVLGIIFLYRLIRKKVIKNKLFYIAWILFFLLSIPHIPVLCGYETTQIGDFYEAKEYKEKYYVIISRQSKEHNNRKVYTLPAEVVRSLDFSHATETDDVYTLNYHINYLYFPNGGYLYFDEPTYSIIQIGQESEVIDYHDDSYYITLTKNKVNP